MELINDCLFPSDILWIPDIVELPQKPVRTDSRKEKQRKASIKYRENKRQTLETLATLKPQLETEIKQLKQELQTTKGQLENVMIWGFKLDQELQAKQQDLFVVSAEAEKYKEEAAKWKAELDHLRALAMEH